MNEEEIHQRIRAIELRNQRVERDKAWERSWMRRMVITAITYGTAGLWLVLIGDAFPWFKAIIPAGGYLLSTFSLPLVKQWWLRHYEK